MELLCEKLDLLQADCEVASGGVEADQQKGHAQKVAGLAGLKPEVIALQSF